MGFEISFFFLLLLVSNWLFLFFFSVVLVFCVNIAFFSFSSVSSSHQWICCRGFQVKEFLSFLFFTHLLYISLFMGLSNLGLSVLFCFLH